MGSGHANEVQNAQNNISAYSISTSEFNQMGSEMDKMTKNVNELLESMKGMNNQQRATKLNSTSYKDAKEATLKKFSHLKDKAKYIPGFTGGLKAIADQVKNTAAIASLGQMGFKETGTDQRSISEMAKYGKISISNITANTNSKGIQVTLSIRNETSNKIWFNVPQGAVIEQEEESGNQNVATTHKFNGSIPAYSSKQFNLPGFCINKSFGSPDQDKMACTILQSLAVLKCFDENAFDKAIADLTLVGDIQRRVWKKIEAFENNVKALADVGF